MLTDKQARQLVSIHAVLRYLERFCNVNMNSVRKTVVKELNVIDVSEQQIMHYMRKHKKEFNFDENRKLLAILAYEAIEAGLNNVYLDNMKLVISSGKVVTVNYRWEALNVKKYHRGKKRRLARSFENRDD